jgi:hypothetical protein
MSAEIAYQKSRKQRSDARTQRDFNTPDGKTDKNANDAAEEDRQPQNDKIDACVGADTGADIRGRSLYDKLRADDAKDVAALEDDAGCDRDFLTPAAQSS